MRFSVLYGMYKHLIDLNDFSRAEWEEIISCAVEIEKHPEKYSHACDGKILATLFYEPSTRTQMSFQTAMLRLGGRIIGFDNPVSYTHLACCTSDKLVTAISSYFKPFEVT